MAITTLWCTFREVPAGRNGERSDNRVHGELAGKLPDQWMPVIDADIDGPGSRAAQIDKDVPALGRFHATRRVARTVFFGATPNVTSANRGLETERIRLGSAFPGEPAGAVADALNRLAAQAPFLYVDRGRYWFDLQQNVNRTAREDADRLLSGDKHEIRAKIVERLKQERGDGEFRRVHVAPGGSDDVADDPMCRLVILGPEATYVAKSEHSPALDTARSILDQRGSAPRQFRNILVFAAVEQRSLDALEQSTAEFLAWDSICDRVDQLNVDAHQRTQATERRRQTDEAVRLRIAEAYQQALVPVQEDPVGSVTFAVSRLDSQGTVAERVSRKLVNEGTLQTRFPAVMLRLQLDDPDRLASRWADGHVAASTLWDDFAKYVYLPRLRDQDVLMRTVEAGPAGTSWETEGFLLADGFDAPSGRYLGLSETSMGSVASPATLVVKPASAVEQLRVDRERQLPGNAGGAEVERTLPGNSARSSDADADPTAVGNVPHRRVVTFRGSKRLDVGRPVQDFDSLVQEVVDAPTAVSRTDVSITVEIVAHNADGFPEATIRTVTENAGTLRFEPGAGFDEQLGD